MRILLTNDDGLHAPGIIALHEAITDAHGQHGTPLQLTAPGSDETTEVLTIAPLTVQSATSHGITYHEPIMVRPMPVTPRMHGIAVDGRPADCVKLAISQLWPDQYGRDAHGKPSRPDLLISGMNAGANCGVNVIYSGTVAAAIEGAFLGVPSIAVSMTLGKGTPRFDVAADHARRTLDMILADGLPEKHECLSINIPVTENDGPMPKVVVCPMNTHGLVDKYERRTSPTGGVYYWASGHGLDFHATEEGSDVQSLKAGCITITPLAYDLTKHASLDRWRKRLHR